MWMTRNVSAAFLMTNEAFTDRARGKMLFTQAVSEGNGDRDRIYDTEVG